MAQARAAALAWVCFDRALREAARPTPSLPPHCNTQSVVEAADFHGSTTYLRSSRARCERQLAQPPLTPNTQKHTQSVVEAADFHGQYHISAEFARALREAAKDLLRCDKLPALAAAGDRGLWLAWVDALIGGC